MEPTDHVAIPYIVEVIAFLLTVVLIVPIFKKIRVSPILGYLAVGTIIGPHALGVVSDVEEVQHFAELGVIFLLFTIGLELSFDRLKAFSKLIFGLGAAQVLLSALAIAMAAYLSGNSAQASSIIGLCLALSSTAMVVNLLKDSGEFASKYGRASFSILLFQDLAVIPILILLSVLGGGSESDLTSSVFTAFFRAIVVVALIVIIGRYALRYLFRTASRTHSVDVFTAMTLLVVLATSLATGYAGLSMALGAFLAGLLLAETEFKHQIESEIEPFKGLFLGLFFMGVGMNLDVVAAFQYGVWVLLSVVGLVLIKGIIITLLCLMFKLKLADSLRAGFLLSESGEFAFVVIGQATLMYGLISVDVGQFMVVVACISMMLTPALSAIGRKIGDRLEPKDNSLDIDAGEVGDVHDHVIIAGFGRMGQLVAEVLGDRGIPYVAIDKNADKIAHFHQKHLPVFVGDVSRRELFSHARADCATALVVTIDDVKAVKHIVQMAREYCPELTIIVRAYDDSHSQELLDAGATEVVVETIEASLQLTSLVLCSMGMSKEEAHSITNQFF